MRPRRRCPGRLVQFPFSSLPLFRTHTHTRILTYLHAHMCAACAPSASDMPRPVRLEERETTCSIVVEFVSLFVILCFACILSVGQALNSCSEGRGRIPRAARQRAARDFDDSGESALAFWFWFCTFSCFLCPPTLSPRCLSACRPLCLHTDLRFLPFGGTPSSS